MEFTFKEYKKFAKKDSMAMLNLGLCYFDGNGIKKDRNNTNYKKNCKSCGCL